MKDFSFQTFSKLYFYRERKKASCISGYKMPHSHRYRLSGSKEEPWGHTLERESCPATPGWMVTGGLATLYYFPTVPFTYGPCCGMAKEFINLGVHHTFL